MDFSKYSNSICIPDQSAWQSINNLKSEHNVLVIDFFNSKNISLEVSKESGYEITHQEWGMNLFGISNSTASGLQDDKNYVISRTNGSLTYKELEPYGKDVHVTSSIINEKTTADMNKNFQPLLWESSNFYQRMERKAIRKNKWADSSNIKLARNLRENREIFFLYVSDHDQINQCNLEGFDYLEPHLLLLWMEREKFVKPQKNAWIFKKWGEDYRCQSWTKNSSFSQIRKDFL